MRANLHSLIETLTTNKVEYVVIGGVAMVLHGSARITQDFDICYARNDQNLKALSTALLPYHAYLRGAPEGLPFKLDLDTLRSGLNFTLISDLGDVDLLGEVSGVGLYEDIKPYAVSMELYNHIVWVMGLDHLEKSKRAAGRLKDLVDLEEIIEIKKRTPTK